MAQHCFVRDATMRVFPSGVRAAALATYQDITMFVVVIVDSIGDAEEEATIVCLFSADDVWLASRDGHGEPRSQVTLRVVIAACLLALIMFWRHW